MPRQPPPGGIGALGIGRRSGAALLALVFVGFISLGLPDGLLGVAWPSIRRTFVLPLDALGPLLLTTAGGYLLASTASGWAVARLGVGRLLALSGFATALALAVYAMAPAWPVVVALGFVAGLGAGAIDAGLNAYVALHHGPRLLNWLHASFGLGAAIGPGIMLAVLGAGLAWRWGYAIVAAVQLGLGAAFLLTAGRWPGPAVSTEGRRDGETEGWSETTGAWRRPVVWLSVALFLVYTGLETTAGQWAYSLFTEEREVAPGLAGLWVSIYWGGLGLGRLLFGFVADRVHPDALLRGAMLGVALGTALLWLRPTAELGFLGLGLIGLAAAPIFPSLIHQTPRRVGPALAARLIGLEVGAASLGIAFGPALAGVLAERLGLEAVPVLLVGAAVGLIGLHEGLVRSS
jgi:fucose permease